MNTADIRGVICALVTPMRENADVDYDGIPRIVNHVVNNGVHGVFALGTNGELFALDEPEKLRVVQAVVRAVDGRVPVYAGCGCVSTRDTVNLARKMGEMGVRGLSVVTPYFITPSQEELYQHYRAVAESAPVPIILYNIPARTGVSLSPETVARLSRVGNIAGIKDSSGNYDNLSAYRELTPPEFTVLAGNDSLILRGLKAGCNGAIAATANVIPRIVSGIYDSFLSGDFEQAERLQESVAALRATFKLGTVPGVLKEAVNCMGIPVGPSRRPILPLTDKRRKELLAVLKENYSEYMAQREA